MSTSKRLIQRPLQEGRKLLHGRKVPPSYAYQQLSSVQLDMEPFEDQSWEKNRTEKELTSYLSSLYDHVQTRKRAIPKYRDADGSIPENPPLFKPLYNYDKTKTTEVDTRPSYYKFMDNIKESNEELYNELNQETPIEELIDLNYLHLHENRNPPKLLNDEEYPDWVWELVPESRKYWWTDLVQLPFENLSQKEKFQLLRKWRKTLMVCNNQWTKSHLGRLGKVRGGYNDPWPKPITTMDIPLYQADDVYYQQAVQHAKSLEKRTKRKKRLESNTDYLRNQNLTAKQMLSAHDEQDSDGLVAVEVGEDIDGMQDHEGELHDEFKLVDLARYYGIDHVDEKSLNVDSDNNKKYGVVYDVKMKEK